MLKQFSAAKKPSPVKIGLKKMAVFGNLRVYILIVATWTPKGTSLAGITPFGVFFVKIRLGV